MATKRIKLLRKCLVGTNPHPKSVGWIGDVDQQEAIGLIAVGYAKETKDEPTKEVELEAVEPRLPLGMKDVQADKLAAILEGIHFRYLQGQTVGPGFDRIGEGIVPLLEAGLKAMNEF